MATTPTLQRFTRLVGVISCCLLTLSPSSLNAAQLSKPIPFPESPLVWNGSTNTIWDEKIHALINTFGGPRSYATALSFSVQPTMHIYESTLTAELSPSQLLLARSTSVKSLSCDIIDLRNGRVIASLKTIGHPAPDTFYWQSDRIIAGVSDWGVELWRVGESTSYAQLADNGFHTSTDQGPATFGVAWKPHSDILGLGGIGRVSLWNGRSGKRIRNIQGLGQTSVYLDWNRSGSRLVTSGNRTIIWNGTNLQRIAEVVGNFAGWSSDGKRFCTIIGNAKKRDKLFTWDENGRYRGSLLLSGRTETYPPVWSFTGRKIAVPVINPGRAAYPNMIDIVDIDTHAQTTIPAHPVKTKALEFGPGKDTLFVAEQNGSIVLWNVRSRKALLTLLFYGPNGDWLAYTLDGRYVGSPGGERHMRWLYGDKLWPGDKFRERLERKNLLQEVVADLK